jgi:sugar phosphate isomerase/epimerase
VPMFGADLRTPFHHHREGQPPLREGRGGDQARLPHLASMRRGRDMLQIGVHALVFVSGWSAGEAVRAVEAAARHGYDVLEIPLIYPGAIDADATARLLQQHGLGTVTSLALPPDADIASADLDSVGRGEALLNDALAVSRDLGSAFMGGVLYSALRKYERARRRRAGLAASLSSEDWPGAHARWVSRSAWSRSTVTRAI